MRGVLLGPVKSPGKIVTDAGIHAVVKAARDDDDDADSLDPRLRRVRINAWPGKNHDAPAASHNWTLRRMYAVPGASLCTAP